jgi:hypothetical protein
VKNTWKYIHDYFQKLLKRYNVGTGLGAKECPTKWTFFQEMLFTIGLEEGR